MIEVKVAATGDFFPFHIAVTADQDVWGELKSAPVDGVTHVVACAANQCGLSETLLRTRTVNDQSKVRFTKLDGRIACTTCRDHTDAMCGGALMELAQDVGLHDDFREP